MDGQQSTAYALTVAGLVASLSLSVVGAAYGTYRSARGAIAAYHGKDSSDEDQEMLLPSSNSRAPDMKTMIRSFIPIVFCGVVAIYGLIIDVIMAAQMDAPEFGLYEGYRCLAAGLTCGFCCLASGIAQGMIGEKGAGALQNGRHMWAIVLQLIYAESLGLYGLVMALILVSSNNK